MGFCACMWCCGCYCYGLGDRRVSGPVSPPQVRDTTVVCGPRERESCSIQLILSRGRSIVYGFLVIVVQGQREERRGLARCPLEVRG